MRTAVVSDFHLGRRSGSDLLRRPAVRRRLLRELRDVDQVVLLGDLLELREARLGAALETARPFFEGLGEALGAGRVVLVPGNHDHALVHGRRAKRRPPVGARGRARDRCVEGGRLGLELVQVPDEPLRGLSRRMGATELVVSYPGLWIRPDVYATHGHYLDCHTTVPTFERIAIAARARVTRTLEKAGRLSPSDYEAVLAPVYGLIGGASRLPRPGRSSAQPDLSIRLWQRLNGGGPGPGAWLLRAPVFAAALAALNAAGLGPLKADLSGEELRRAGLRAMAEVVRRLEIGATHVVFGHTHRAGPLDEEGEEWTLPHGTRLWNTGSWVYEPALLGGSPSESPYWPGACLLVDDSGAPRLRRLLDPETFARDSA